MKLTLKILKLFAILIITVSIILFVSSLLLQDKVATSILKSINKNISTKFDFGTLKLSFLRKFPKASLELKDVLIHSSSDFDQSGFIEINTDTLLWARDVVVEFKITNIIKGIYKIERVSVKNGKMNFFTDTAGHVNYDLSVKTLSTERGVFSIDLERINLSNINTNYNNLATKLIIRGLVKNGRIKSVISGDNIDFAAKADMQISNFQLFNFKISKTISTGLDLTLLSSKSGVLFKKGTLNVENYDFGLSGLISSENMLDLNVTGHNIDIAKIRKYLPPKYYNIVSKYDPSGVLVINSKIKGKLTRISNPNLEINFFLKDGRITYGKSHLTINNLSFTGNFSNGIKKRPETSSLSIRDIKAMLGSAEFTGEFKLYGFDNPSVELVLRGKVIPEELKEFFDLQDISTAKGSVDINLRVSGRFDPKKKYSFSDFVDLKPEADLNFNSLTLGLKNDKFQINNVNGILTLSNTIQSSNLEFTYKGHKVKIDGEFKNLPEWLDNRPVKMIATAEVFFSRLNPDLFLKDNSLSDTISGKKIAVTMPDDIIIDINFRIDTLDYKSFSSSKIIGTLTYKPRVLTIKSFNMKSLNGIISGNGFIVQSSNKSVIARGSFNVTNIDVNSVFTTFHNFGQTFIKAENLKGSLSGSLSILMPMDSMLNPLIKSISAEGKYILANGSLINFDPVKQLSSFIELSEMENISFAKMENDFFIRNNFLYIPQMDVKSSAADLTVNGKHSFDNVYEYHVKMLLSEFLSKKRKKNIGPVTEFGVVEDDGLGRTSLLLKIVGKGEEIKVGYDLKAARSGIKSSVKSERQALKTILNQEYGWYKSDTMPKKEPVNKKSRFRISWDETDSANVKTDTPSSTKKSYVKNLFKKK